MFNVRRHGGQCCGISHIWGLPYNYGYKFGSEGYYKEIEDSFKKAEKRAFNNNKRRGYFRPSVGGHTVELSLLIEGQREFIKFVESIGYTRSFTLRNGNSSFAVGIFHKQLTQDMFMGKKEEKKEITNPFSVRIPQEAVYA